MHQGDAVQAGLRFGDDYRTAEAAVAVTVITGNPADSIVRCGKNKQNPGSLTLVEIGILSSSLTSSHTKMLRILGAAHHKGKPLANFFDSR
jgi:hypothetical protein